MNKRSCSVELKLTEHDWSRLKIFDHRLMVACSGGVDSVVLVDQLHKATQSYPQLKLTICHINFHLRPNQSDEDERFVKQLAYEYNHPFLAYHPFPRFSYHHSHSSSTPHTAPPKRSFETWARKVKIEAVFYAQSLGMAIAMAHHQDDLYETILFRMARGCQPWNLKGMTRWHQGIFRPFLNIDKAHILAYVQHHKLRWLEDSTNQDLTITRNLIRQQIIPKLRVTNQAAKQNILTLAQRCEEISDHHFSRMSSIQNKGYLRLDEATLRSESSLVLAIGQLTEDLSLSSKQWRSLADSLKQTQQASYLLPGGTLYRKGPYLRFFASPDSNQPSYLPIRLYPGIGLTITLQGLHHNISLQLAQPHHPQPKEHRPSGLIIQTLEHYLKGTRPSQSLLWSSSHGIMKASPKHRLKFFSAAFRKAQVRDDIFAHLAQNLLLICTDQIIWMAISPHYLYKLEGAHSSSSSQDSAPHDHLNLHVFPHEQPFSINSGSVKITSFYRKSPAPCVA